MAPSSTGAASASLASGSSASVALARLGGRAGVLGGLGLVGRGALVVVGRFGAGRGRRRLAVLLVLLVGGRAAGDRHVGTADRHALGVDLGGGDRRTAQRGDHAVLRVGRSEQLEGDAGVGRGQLLDLLPDLLGGLEPEVGAEPAGQVGRDDPVGAGGARAA